jgi:hypothetical protein
MDDLVVQQILPHSQMRPGETGKIERTGRAPRAVNASIRTAPATRIGKWPLPALEGWATTPISSNWLATPPKLLCGHTPDPIAGREKD